MKIPPHIPCYGNQSYRGDCPREDLEQVSIINRIRQVHPETYGRIVLHPRNEGLKEKGQFSSVLKHKAEGMTKGASDVIVPGKPTFVCEVKRQDHTKSTWQDGQIEFLEAAQASGAFVCVALGAVAAWQAFEEWVRLVEAIKETSA